MRICLNKKADSRFLKAECKRERVEGQSLCHGCVAEGIHHMEDEFYMPITGEEPRRYRQAAPPTYVSTSRPLSARRFADVWYTSTTASTATI